MRGYSIIELQHARPIKQRPESDVRYCECCGARLARDNYEALCSPCATKADSTPPDVLARHGLRVHPEYPAHALKELVRHYFGTLSAAERMLGWKRNTISNWTRCRRETNNHAVIPQWRCDAINRAIEEIERR